MSDTHDMNRIKIQVLSTFNAYSNDSTDDSKVQCRTLENASWIAKIACIFVQIQAVTNHLDMFLRCKW